MVEAPGTLIPVTLVEQYAPGLTLEAFRAATDLVGSSGSAPIVTFLVREEETIFSIFAEGVRPVAVVPALSRQLEFARVVPAVACWSARDPRHRRMGAAGVEVHR